MISFIFCFHSVRTENLKQSLRLLFRREQAVIGEVILVCNDHTDECFPDCRLINMGMKEYRKQEMCNLGVRQARGGVIALLDSDRVLPPGYFSDAYERLEEGSFVSCRRMLNLVRPHTDEEIESGELEFEEEFRSEGWDLWRKNLFSGNTMFHKQDYLSSGGMDESFVGYGFADTDMTRNVLSQGFRAVWLEGAEIHLHHEKNVSCGGEIKGQETRKKMADSNLCRFLKKWRMREYLRSCGCML